MYSNVGAYITHHHYDPVDRMVYVSAKELPDDCFAIRYYSI